MELIAKQGFKQTEVGMIPLDWKIDFLNSIVDKRRTIRYGIVQPGKYDPNGKYLIRGQDYSFGWSSPDSFFRVSPQIEEPYKNARVKEGDIIITIVGASTGHVEVIPKWLDASNLTQTTARIAVDPSKGYSLFFKHYLISKFGQAQVANYIKGAAQPGLNCGDIEKFLVILPPTLTEQKAIATALSDVDDLIANLDKLITKKKAIKQGAMQQLLTPPHKGGKRLTGFTGEWVEKTIKDVVSTPVSDGPHETPKFVKDGVPFLSVNNIVNNRIDYTNLRHISKEDDIIYSRKCKPTKNDILLGKAASVGKVAIVERDWDFNIWSPLALIRLKSEYNHYFVFYSFQTERILKQIDFLTNSSSQGNIGMGDIEKLKIYFPINKDEQKQIAETLYIMDKDVEKLELKKAKYQDIKQGMMQELLTGKIRLV